MKPGPVYIRNKKRSSKYEPPVTPATLLHANPDYAHVQLPSGIETTVNIRDIAPQQMEIDACNDVGVSEDDVVTVQDANNSYCDNKTNSTTNTLSDTNSIQSSSDMTMLNTNDTSTQIGVLPVRRSQRLSKKPERYGDYEGG